VNAGITANWSENIISFFYSEVLKTDAARFSPIMMEYSPNRLNHKKNRLNHKKIGPESWT
jgi:hypothetical protein